MGVARFRVAGEIPSEKPYRTIRADFSCFFEGFSRRRGGARTTLIGAALVDTLRDFATANELKIDWDDVEQASNEALRQRASYDEPLRRQGKSRRWSWKLPIWKSRAENLVAISKIELSRGADAPRQVH